MSLVVKVTLVGFEALAGLLTLLIGLLVLRDIQNDVTTDDANTADSAATTELTSQGYTSDFATYRHAAVAADAPHCSTLGTEIMAKKGGSTTDAAIATAFCVGTINRQSAGVGGGNLMTIYDTPRGESEKKMVAIIARGTAPAVAYEDMFVNATNTSTIGGLSVAVPGEVMGFYEAWKMFGRIPWSDLITPSVKLSREGFSITQHLANAIIKKEESIRSEPNLAEILLHPDGSLRKKGELLVDEKYAVTLERIAADPLAFYTGSLAEDIVADLAEYNSIITLSDLMDYTAKVKDTVSTTLHNGNLTFHTPPPPSSGAVLNYIMNILDGYEMSNVSRLTLDDQILTYHRIIEAFKFGFAERSALGDADFVNVTEILQTMMSDDRANSIRSRINDAATAEDVWWYNPSFENREDSGTAHASLLGADGSAVSVSLTINFYFGSQIRGSRTGIIFNNEMDDFSIPGQVNTFGLAASPSNFIQPGKRPMSSMSPLVVLDQEGRTILVTGAAGGPRIITAIALVSIHSLWLGDRIDIATDRHRFDHHLTPDRVSFEKNFSQEILTAFEARGHATKQFRIHIGVVESVHSVCPRCGDICAGVECIHAACDGRKGGPPDGF